MVFAILAIFVMLFHLLPGAIAERKGSDSSPPDEGDWVINSPGNYIGNETILITGEAPDPTIVDTSVQVNGTVYIRDGGVLTLFNTPINMTDNTLERFIIEEGGKLVMTNNSIITNNNGGLIGSVEISGELHINGGQIANTWEVTVESADALLNLSEASFSTNSSFYLNNQTISLFRTSFFSPESTPLIVTDSIIEWQFGSLMLGSNSTTDPVLKVIDSTLILRGVTTYSASNQSIHVVLVDSTFQALNRTSLGGNAATQVIQATGSTLLLSNLSRLSTDGTQLMSCLDSDITFLDTDLGYYRWYSNSFIPEMVFDTCTITFTNVGFHRFSNNAIRATDSSIFISDSNFWNITGNAIDLEDSDLIAESTNFYCLQGNGIMLRDSTADLTNVTFDEDDRNHTNGYPYPPIYSGYGVGIMGSPIISYDSDVSIRNSVFSAHEYDALIMIRSSLDLRDSIFRSPGSNTTDLVNGMTLEDSTAVIEENRFYTPYRGGGFVLNAVNTVPLDVDTFLGSNNFSDGRIYRQVFELSIRVVDSQGSGIPNVEVNLTNDLGEERIITDTITGGWTRYPFQIPAFGILLKGEKGGQGSGGNSRNGDFTNESYNEYHLIATKDYPTYNFSISTSQWLTVDRSMSHEVMIEVSTPDLIVKGGGVYPVVLQDEELKITAILMNRAEGPASNVTVNFLASPVGSDVWTDIGSDVLDVPGIFDGGNHAVLNASIMMDLDIGEYLVRMVIDPADTVHERDETNNEYSLSDPFEVYSRPWITVLTPGEDEIISGTVIISGHAEDQYENRISVELRINGFLISVPEVSRQPDGVYWSAIWDTAAYDSSLGMDSYPNGPHAISVRCMNTNPYGLATSEWFNITVTVANAPVISIDRPWEGEFINITSGIPIYQIMVDVLDYRDLHTVSGQIDGGQPFLMTRIGADFRSTIDVSHYADGSHTLEVFGYWGYGNVSTSVTFLLNSPAEESFPQIFLDHEITDEGLRVHGSTWDDTDIEWVRISLDGGPWLTLSSNPGNATSFEYFWERVYLVPDSHNVSVRVFDGFDVSEREIWVIVDLFYDLSITDIKQPRGILEKDWVNFTVMVENTGPYASPSGELNLYIGNIMRTVQGLSIPANSEVPIMISWRAKPGNHTISADVNYAQHNTERNPNNNVFVSEELLFVTPLPTTGSDDDESDSNTFWYAAAVALALGILAILAFVSPSRTRGDQSRLPGGRVRSGQSQRPTRPRGSGRPPVRRPLPRRTPGDRETGMKNENDFSDDDYDSDGEYDSDDSYDDEDDYEDDDDEDYYDDDE